MQRKGLFVKMIKKILLILSILFLTIFFILGFVCVVGNYFYDIANSFFSWLNSIGITTGVLIISSIIALVLGIVFWTLYDKFG